MHVSEPSCRPAPCRVVGGRDTISASRPRISRPEKWIKPIFSCHSTYAQDYSTWSNAIHGWQLEPPHERHLDLMNSPACPRHIPRPTPISAFIVSRPGPLSKPWKWMHARKPPMTAAGPERAWSGKFFTTPLSRSHCRRVVVHRP